MTWIHFTNFSIGPFERRTDAEHHWRVVLAKRGTVSDQPHPRTGAQWMPVSKILAMPAADQAQRAEHIARTEREITHD